MAAETATPVTHVESDTEKLARYERLVASFEAKLRTCSPRNRRFVSENASHYRRQLASMKKRMAAT